MAAILASVAVAVAAPAGRADHTAPPWQGGVGVVSSQESTFAALSSRVANRQTYVVCNSPDEWLAVAAARGFDPNRIAGFVPVVYGVVQNWTELHPVVCEALDRFMHARPQSPCVLGHRLESRAVRTTERVRVRKRVNGRLRWVWVTRQRTRTTQVRVPVTGPCAQVDLYVQSIWTLTHESVHLAGVGNEIAAECFGMQLVPWATLQLGANTAYAIETGQRAWALYQTGPYFHGECREGGELDLAPTSSQWPRELPHASSHEAAPVARPGDLRRPGPILGLTILQSELRS